MTTEHTFKNVDRLRNEAELWLSTDEPSLAGVEQALSLAFEQLGVSKLYVASTARVYEEAGFSRHEAGRMSILEADWRVRRGSGPKVVLMQPQFLPWLGYLELIDRADVFVFLDDFQLLRRSWGQRNRLFAVPGKVDIVTLPVRHERDQNATFVQLQEAETVVWRRKLRNLLNFTYRKAPYGDVVLDLVDRWLAREYPNIAELQIEFIHSVADYLSLRPRFVRSSTLATNGARRSSRLAVLLDKLGAGAYISAHGSFPYMQEDAVFPLQHIPVFFQNHVPRPYRQHGSAVFEPRLSCLDALANLPADELRGIIRGTDWWQSWEERAASEELSHQV